MRTIKAKKIFSSEDYVYPTHESKARERREYKEKHQYVKVFGRSVKLSETEAREYRKYN